MNNIHSPFLNDFISIFSFSDKFVLLLSIFIFSSSKEKNVFISELFKIIGIHKEGIKWSEYPFDLPDEELPLKEEIEVDNSDWKDYLREILNGE